MATHRTSKEVRTRIGTIFLLALAYVIIAPPQFAAATNFGGCRYGDENDPCFSSTPYPKWTYELGPRMRGAVEATRTGSYNTTTLEISLAPDPDVFDTYFGIDNNISPPFVGFYHCIAPGPILVAPNQHACNTATITFKGNAIANWSNTALQGLACHEVGHSFGLRHPTVNNTTTYGCMVSGAPFPATMNQHNAAHINSFYPYTG